MAQGFARALGRGLLVADSAGLTPVYDVPDATIRMMRERGLDISAQYPQPVNGLDLRSYDLILNMTGLSIPSLPPVTTRNWIVPDPVGRPDSVLREVRDEIESLVMGLVLELRQQREQWELARSTRKLRGV